MKESRDILSLFEALNSHEVFTPPRVARQMLDLLPAKIWSDPSIKILDPCTKSGVFLRESFFRLFTFLDGKGIYETENGEIYDLDDKQQRINHILKNMLFGIATSELTGYVSRRTLYGVMRANSDKQISSLDAFMQSSNYHQWTEEEKSNFIGRNKFNEYFDHNLFCTPEYKGFEQEGNIFYPNDEVKKLVMEEDDYEIEDKYFPFIEENTKHKKILDIRGGEMKFDVIVGNPPYQVGDGGSGASALPIYNKFIEQALLLMPKHLSMIIPSRWFVGGRGLDEFRRKMLNDKRIAILHDFPNAPDCFPGVEIKGGVCYFLWNKNVKVETCEITTHISSDKFVKKRSLLEEGLDTFIRFHESVSIVKKVRNITNESLTDILSPGRHFGFHTKVSWRNKNQGLLQTADGKRSIAVSKIKTDHFNTKVFIAHGECWVNFNDIEKNKEDVCKYKVIIPRSGNPGGTIIGKPKVSEPSSCSSNTYIVAIPNCNNEITSKNLLTYLKTKFVRYLIALRTSTQDMPPKAYELVPMVDLSKEWSDEKLYREYSLSADEVNHIESTMRNME